MIFLASKNSFLPSISSSSVSAACPSFKCLAIVLAVVWNAIYPDYWSSDLKHLQNAQDQIDELIGFNQKMIDMIKQKKIQEYEPQFGVSKFFHEHFEKAFNVKYLQQCEYVEEEVEEQVEVHGQTRIDEYYQGYRDYYEEMSELYAESPGTSLRDRLIYVKWVARTVGYGVYANVNIPAGTYLGDFVGLYNKRSGDTSYMWNYPVQVKKKDGGWVNLGIDAIHSGNMMRFPNAPLDKSLINTEVVYFKKNGRWTLGYRTKKLVKKGEQILISYGSAYWTTRQAYDPRTGEILKNNDEAETSPTPTPEKEQVFEAEPETETESGSGGDYYTAEYVEEENEGDLRAVK